MIANAGERFDDEGNLTDDDTRKHIQKLVETLAQWTRQLQKAQL
jgi:hypothetical protein